MNERISLLFNFANQETVDKIIDRWKDEDISDFNANRQNYQSYEVKQRKAFRSVPETETLQNIKRVMDRNRIISKVKQEQLLIKGI